jgi:molecular chaperone DnaK
MDLVADEFMRRHGLDPRQDPNTAGRLWRECEDAKRTLSARAKTHISCDFKGQAVRIEVSREKFEEITRDLLDRTQFTTRQTLQASGLSWNDIDNVLLVGGSTRMPMVGQMLRQLSGKEPDGSVAVDEAVAHGAALHAGVILAKQRGEKPVLRIRNVNSHSLGVVATDAQTGRKRNAIVIPRNTALPVTAKRVFRTQKANQASILVQIVEGESASPDDCTQIGQCVVRNLPRGLPAQTPIDVIFEYQDNGRLMVHVSVGNTGANLQHEITRDNSLTQEQLDAWRQYITGEAPTAK